MPWMGKNIQLTAIDDRNAFCDGFKVVAGNFSSNLDIKRFLQDNDVDSKLPINHSNGKYRSVRLSSHEQSITKTLKNLKNAYEPMRKEMLEKGGIEICPIISQFDVTQDFKATFYATHEWKQYQRKIMADLKKTFNTDF